MIDEIANTLPTDTKFVKNKSALEKCLGLDRNTDSDLSTDTNSTDFFIPDVTPDSNPVAPEGAVPAHTSDGPVNSMVSGRGKCCQKGNKNGFTSRFY